MDMRRRICRVIIKNFLFKKCLIQQIHVVNRRIRSKTRKPWHLCTLLMVIKGACFDRERLMYAQAEAVDSPVLRFSSCDILLIVCFGCCILCVANFTPRTRLDDLAVYCNKRSIRGETFEIWQGGHLLMRDMVWHGSWGNPEFLAAPQSNVNFFFWQ